MWNLSRIQFTFAAKQAKAKNYYQILELPSTAPMAGIRKNYLRLAKIYHPDVYKSKDGRPSATSTTNRSGLRRTQEGTQNRTQEGTQEGTQDGKQGMAHKTDRRWIMSPNPWRR